jgi:hypothetical protein
MFHLGDQAQKSTLVGQEHDPHVIDDAIEIQYCDLLEQNESSL